MQCSVCKGEGPESRFNTIVISNPNGSTQWFLCSPDCARAFHIHHATWITLRIATSTSRIAPINNPLEEEDQDHEVH